MKLKTIPVPRQHVEEDNKCFDSSKHDCNVQTNWEINLSQI